MLTAGFLVFLLLHIAFGFAIGFFVLMFAVKQESWLKILGFVFGWFIISLAALVMLISILWAFRYPMGPYGPMHPGIMKERSSDNYRQSGLPQRNQGTMMNQQHCPYCD